MSDTDVDVETAPDEAAFTPDDTEGHRAAIEQYQEDRAERQQRLQQSLSVKERLEQKAAEQTHDIDVLGIPVTFTRLPSDEELALVEIGERFQRLGEDDLGRETLKEMRDEVAAIIANNVAGEMVDPLEDPPRMDDARWWTETLGLVDLIMTGAALAQQNDAVDESEIEEFRDE
jgi:hypothetical protein